MVVGELLLFFIKHVHTVNVVFLVMDLCLVNRYIPAFEACGPPSLDSSLNVLVDFLSLPYQLHGRLIMSIVPIIQLNGLWHGLRHLSLIKVLLTLILPTVHHIIHALLVVVENVIRLIFIDSVRRSGGRSCC